MGSETAPNGHIEWWDDPDVDTPSAKGFNKRYYRHVGCDEGESPWIVPQDDGAPPPSRTADECPRCCLVAPLRPRPVGSERPPTPEQREDLSPLLLSALRVVEQGRRPTDALLAKLKRRGLIQRSVFESRDLLLTDAGRRVLAEGAATGALAEYRREVGGEADLEAGAQAGVEWACDEAERHLPRWAELSDDTRLRCVEQTRAVLDAALSAQRAERAEDWREALERLHPLEDTGGVGASFEEGFEAGWAARAGEGERPTYADSPMRAEAEGLYDRSRTTEGNRAQRAGEPPTPDGVERACAGLWKGTCRNDQARHPCCLRCCSPDEKGHDNE